MQHYVIRFLLSTGINPRRISAECLLKRNRTTPLLRLARLDHEGRSFLSTLRRSYRPHFYEIVQRPAVDPAEFQQFDGVNPPLLRFAFRDERLWLA